MFITIKVTKKYIINNNKLFISEYYSEPALNDRLKK